MPANNMDRAATLDRHLTRYNAVGKFDNAVFVKAERAFTASR